MRRAFDVGGRRLAGLGRQGHGREVQSQRARSRHHLPPRLIISSFGIIRCWDQLTRLMTSAPRGIGKSVHSPGQAAFCELMVGARKAAGLTQHALALRLKKPQSFVAKYEGGERRLDVVEFITIARALDVDPLKLMAILLSGGKGKSPRAKRNS